MRLDPYNRILLAAKNGMGVHLDAQEVRALAIDCAIETRAAVIEENQKLWFDQLRDSAPKPRYFGCKATPKP